VEVGKPFNTIAQEITLSLPCPHCRPTPPPPTPQEKKDKRFSSKIIKAIIGRRW